MVTGGRRGPEANSQKLIGPFVLNERGTNEPRQGRVTYTRLWKQANVLLDVIFGGKFLPGSAKRVQISLVLAILVIDQDHGTACGDFREQFADRRKRGGFGMIGHGFEVGWSLTRDASVSISQSAVPK